MVRPIDGKLTLMFRAANARQNVVQEASAQLRMLRDEVTEEGFRIRRIVDLALVRSQHPGVRPRLDHHARHRRDEPAAGESAESLERGCGDLHLEPQRHR